MSPNSLEAAGLISQSEYSKIAMITQSAGADAHKKIVGKSIQIYFYVLFLNYNLFVMLPIQRFLWKSER